MGLPQEVSIFLAINNEQKGPFTSAKILEMIENNEIPSDAMIWHEGFKDWQPIMSIEDYKEAFSKVKKPTQFNDKNSFPKVTTLNQFNNPKEHQEKEEVSLKPLFSNSAIEKRTIKQYLLPFILVINGICLILGSYFAYFYFQRNTSTSNIEKYPLKREKKTIQNIEEVKKNERNFLYEKALSNITLNPNEAVITLEKLLADNSNDDIGAKSAELLIDYYKQKRAYGNVAKVQLKLGKAEEAYNTFIRNESPMYSEGEKALFEAIKIAPLTKKKELLLEDIRLLLGPLNNPELAVDRIKLFEKEFKGQKHPFGYYLKSEEERINELFKRLAFSFVNKLLAHISSDFPQMGLTKRPVVSVVKTKNKYYIMGSYTGDISLAEDILSDIKMVFWFWNERWILVNTNLTEERSKWAQKEKENLKDIGYDVHDMLTYLEGVFKYQFPKNAFHEEIGKISELQTITTNTSK